MIADHGRDEEDGAVGELAEGVEEGEAHGEGDAGGGNEEEGGGKLEGLDLLLVGGM